MALVYSKVYAPNFPSGLCHSPSSPLDDGTWKKFGRKKQKRDKGNAGAGGSSAEVIIDVTIDTVIDITMSST